MSATLNLSIEAGETAELTELRGDFVSVASSRAYPPGSTLRATLAASGDPVEVKVRGSKRRGDTFEVEGRLINVTKQVRTALLRAFEQPE